jgi:hypothetical protein
MRRHGVVGLTAGHMALGLLLVGAPPPALAQGGATCLFQCDSKCYGTTGPYCYSQCMAECNSGASSAPSVRQSYGAVYSTDNGSGAYGYSYQFGDEYGAIAEAERQCKARSDGAPCAQLILFDNKCAAVIFAKKNDDIVDITGSAEPLQSDADAEGLASCQQHNPDAQCTVVDRFCSE